MITKKYLDLYHEACRRLRRTGIEDPTRMIASLEQEINGYRNKIRHLERLLNKFPDSAPAERFTRYDEVKKCYVATFEMNDASYSCTAVGDQFWDNQEGGHTEPYLYGPLIDRLGVLEDQAERADDQDQEEMQKNGDRQKNPIFF